MKINLRNTDRERGFSMVELMVVGGIILIICAAAMLQIQGALTAARRETALATVLTQMRQAHEISIDQRKVYRLTFNAPSTMLLEVQVITYPGGVKTINYAAVSTMQLPTGYSFLTIVGQPTAVGTTPDGLGAGNNAIDFGIGASGGGLNQIYFQPDGHAFDNVGRTNNGVVYVGKAGELYSLRAVTMYGAAGRMKPWFLNQVAGAPVWVAR